MNATRDTAPTRKLGTLFGQLAHGGLLMTGMVAACYLGVVQLHQSPDQNSQEDSILAVTPAKLVPASERAVEVAVPAAGGPVKPVAYAPEDEHKLSAGMLRVRDYLARRFRVSGVALEPLLLDSEVVGRKLGLDPLLLVAMIGVESRFNPFAESASGAQGLMQIIPRFHLDKIGPNPDEDALFDPTVNIRVGAMVLKENLRRTGEVATALQYYNGDPTDPDASYANKVLSLKGRLEQAARRGV